MEIEKMRFSEFADVPVIDGHVHFGNFGAGSVQWSLDELQRLSASYIDVMRKGKLSGMYVTGGDAGLCLKVKYPTLFYSGGFVPWSGETDSLPNVDWDAYIATLKKLGYEGVGEMGNKPVLRNKHTPLDSSYYKGFWEACESQDFPVLCHVADPEEFWDENLAPDWAKKQRWVYYLDDYPKKEELNDEMENVLSGHPDLKVVLCHFYFISADLEKAEDFLNCYRNVGLDLTLGIELMYNISRRRDDWRTFFIKHQDRIFFGTDIATWQTIQETVDRIWLIRNFLESDEEFFTPSTADKLLTRYEKPFLGLKLPKEAIRKIYAGNFQRLWGKKPKKVNRELALKILRQKGEKAVADAIEETTKN
jgi:predicted TIM-barrel fold metal-dependent hydrolase